MDLISTLASQLGIDSSKAEALVGSVLGTIQNAVSEKYGVGSATQLATAIPELGAWKNKATALLGGQTAAANAPDAGGLGGMLAGLTGSGGGNMADLLALVGKLDIDAAKLALIAQQLMSFLQQRTDAGLLDKIKAVAPFLSGDGDDDDGVAKVASGIGKSLRELF